MLTYLWSRL